MSSVYENGALVHWTNSFNRSSQTSISILTVGFYYFQMNRWNRHVRVGRKGVRLSQRFKYLLQKLHSNKCVQKCVQPLNLFTRIVHNISVGKKLIKMFYVQLKCYQFLVQLSSCIHRQIRWKVALTLRISSLCGHSLTSRRHEEIHVDVDSVKDLSAFHYFLQKDKKKQ